MLLDCQPRRYNFGPQIGGHLSAIDDRPLMPYPAYSKVVTCLLLTGIRLARAQPLKSSISIARSCRARKVLCDATLLRCCSSSCVPKQGHCPTRGGLLCSSFPSCRSARPNPLSYRCYFDAGSGCWSRLHTRARRNIESREWFAQCSYRHTDTTQPWPHGPISLCLRLERNVLHYQQQWFKSRQTHNLGHDSIGIFARRVELFRPNDQRAKYSIHRTE